MRWEPRGTRAHTMKTLASLPQLSSSFSQSLFPSLSPYFINLLTMMTRLFASLSFVYSPIYSNVPRHDFLWIVFQILCAFILSILLSTTAGGISRNIKSVFFKTFRNTNTHYNACITGDCERLPVTIMLFKNH